MKTRLVIFEGTDGSGKSTQFQLYRYATEFQPLILDRFTGSNIIFDKIFDRKDSSLRLFKVEDELNKIFDVYVIYLWADDEILLKRVLAQKQINSPEKINEIKELNKQMKWAYQWYLSKTPFKQQIQIDTSDISPIEITRMVLDFTKEKERNDEWTRFYKS